VTPVTERGQDTATVAAPEACGAIWEFLGIEAPCGRPVIGRFRRICVHEHVRDGWLCRDHAENPRRLCLTCRDLPDGLSHLCPITIAAVTPLCGPT
jgi:hypothetical protein